MYVNARAIIERGLSARKGAQILIQLRDKAGEQCYELPGGRLEEFESFFDGLKREVLEETGLTLTRVKEQNSRVCTDFCDTSVECFHPFAVYQTTRGPVDSVGVYFLCEAEGELLKCGDNTKDIRWVGIDELKEMITGGRFSWIDLAGVEFYLAGYDLA